MNVSGNHSEIAVALCADDYGIAPGVDDGIFALAEAGRISAFSCMTAAPRWRQAAARIAPLFGRIDIGLHFALTQLAPLGPMPSLAPDGTFPAMGSLYRRSLVRHIDLDEIESELTRQIDIFAEAAGRLPDFLDGHHHVHQLPGIRDVVARTWRARVPQGWVRNTATTPRRILSRGIAMPRAMVLAWFGRAAKRTWQTAGIVTNTDFAGVRNFDERQPYRTLMQRYLGNARDGLLIMCHPGRPDETLAGIDWVTGARSEELAYLAGDDFLADLAAANCRLVRLSSSAGR